MATDRTYDHGCYDLAETFLRDNEQTNPDRATVEKHARELAGRIQQTIEDYFEEVTQENPREKGDDDGVEYGDPRDAMDERLES